VQEGSRGYPIKPDDRSKSPISSCRANSIARTRKEEMRTSGGGGGDERGGETTPRIHTLLLLSLAIHPSFSFHDDAAEGTATPRYQTQAR
jgi:hypothetical protein